MNIRQQIRGALVVDQLVCKRDGTFLAREGYFYRGGNSEDKLAQKIKNVLEPHFAVTVIDSGDHWTPFRGASPLESQSHFYVHFSVKGT